MSRQKKKEKIKHWSHLEDFQYYFFLLLHYKMISKNKKESKIYVQMSKFIKQKNPTQCRTHHEKKIKELRLEKSGNAEIQNLHHFYQQNYTDRLLDTGQLKLELLAFLSRKEKENGNQIGCKSLKIIEIRKLSDFKENIDDIIQELNFGVLQVQIENSLIEVRDLDTNEKESEMKNIGNEEESQYFKNDYLDEFYNYQSSEWKQI